jgi:hypothetical protein
MQFAPQHQPGHSATEGAARPAQSRPEFDIVAHTTMQALTALQRTHGNQYVARLVRRTVAERAAVVQRFDPAGHEQATVGGLRGDYSAAEIGAIYTANWERDFSQGPVPIANAAIAWKAVKLSAMRNNGMPSPAASQRFRTAIEAVIRMSMFDAQDESMGGYRYWEHMDNPGGRAAANANRRWYGASAAPAGALPGNIMDSRAYIKDEIVAAVDAYRAKLPGAHALAPSINNWQQGTRRVDRPRGYGRSRTSANPDDRAPVAEETAVMASDQGARSGAVSPAFAAAAPHLGRAMHGTEDFFAHSTWVEVANAPAGGSPQQVITGTFERPDKIHALGHKLTSFAEALLRDYDVLLRVYNRSASDIHDQPNPITMHSRTLPGEAIDVVGASSTIENRVFGTLFRRPQARMEDYIASRTFLENVRQKGELMIAHGEREAPSTGHARIAKDSPSSPDYETAVALARAADNRIFGPLRAAMDNADDAAVRQQVLETLRMVDQIIAPPTASNPLLEVLHDLGRPRGDFPVPGSDAVPV